MYDSVLKETVERPVPKKVVYGFNDLGRQGNLIYVEGLDVDQSPEDRVVFGC